MEQGLNLIQQLQQTPKWKEFEEWYYTQMVDNNYISPIDVWLSSENSDTSFQIGAFNLPFDFLKGVFEKFICKDATNITVDGYLGKETYSSILNKSEWKWFNSFEEFLIWYFNN